MMSPRRDRQAARQDFTITEHRTAHVPSTLVTDHDLAATDELSRAGVLTCRPTPSGYDVGAGSHVGVITLDRIRLELRPKFALTGEQLVSWLSYAIDVTPYRPRQRRGWDTAHGGLVDLVVGALIDECRQLIRYGLRRDYLREDRVEPVLRGRLDVQAQTARRYGMVDRLHVQTFDRRPDVWENYVCHAALQVGSRLARDSTVARLAAETAHAFPAHPRGRSAAEQTLHRATYHRMNHAYRPAHAWAALLFGRAGPADLLRHAHLQARSLLIDMNVMWESIVRRMITEAVGAGGTVVPPRGAHALLVCVEGGANRALQPDVLVRFPADGTTLPIDAKYKHASAKVISRDDLYQVLTYASAYPMPAPPRAMVVHPSEAGWTHNWVSVTGPRGLLGEVLVVGVDIQRHPGNAGEELGRALHTVLNRQPHDRSPRARSRQVGA